MAPDSLKLDLWNMYQAEVQNAFNHKIDLAYDQGVSDQLAAGGGGFTQEQVDQMVAQAVDQARSLLKQQVKDALASLDQAQDQQAIDVIDAL